MSSNLSSETVERYEQLRDQWKSESWVSPTAASMKKLKSFRELVALGEIIIPLILMDIQREVPFMHIFLYELTTDRPTKHVRPGNITGIEQAWLEWGILKGYLDQK